MKGSADRILTTHVGSLPRPRDLLDMVLAKDRGQPYDEKSFPALLRRSVSSIVEKQVQTGLDVVDDGEFGKPGFMHYVNQRLAGFELMREAPASPFAASRDYLAFPEYYAAQPTSPARKAPHMVCTGPISYRGHAALAADIANLKAALAGVAAEEAFMPAVSPSNVEEWQRNRYYKTDEEFLFAVAEAMREEYRAIVDAGLILQIDDPRLVTRYNVTPQASVADCRKWAEARIEALNHALRGLPRERIRFHTCYGINIGPRVHDMELKDVVDLILRVNAGAYSFEAANPRHEHEWAVWKEVKLPEGALLIPGVITQSGVVVEHPEAVAQRLERFAGVVGRENVMAGADCGFGTFAGADEIDERIVWAKLAALVEGARIASARLWKRS
ncbi:MAG: cobalamin-independent methionine synthase II family protein [Betaproteobacteria bacterium]|nr:cobalamin-independent methionine synthase II family protein [Betaproteobacteria bacterium]